VRLILAVLVLDAQKLALPQPLVLLRLEEVLGLDAQQLVLARLVLGGLARALLVLLHLVLAGLVLVVRRRAVFFGQRNA